jgi:hypothetical protein
VWTGLVTPAGGNTIDTGQLQGTGGICISRVLTASSAFVSNQWAEMTVGTGGTVADMGIMTRIQSPTNTAGYLLYINNATSLQFYTIDSSTSAVGIGAAFTVSTLVAGDKIRAYVVGNVLSAYVNYVDTSSVPVFQRTDGSSTYSNGQPGWYTSTPARYISLFSAGI